jgi:hypothetical protein
MQATLTTPIGTLAEGDIPAAPSPAWVRAGAAGRGRSLS